MVQLARKSIRWVVLGVVVAAGILALVSLVQTSDPGGGIRSETRDGQRGVVLTDGATREHVAGLQGALNLKDPTPLFLPTPWNSGQVVSEMTAERAPGASFGGIEAKFLFPKSENGLRLPDGVEVPPTVFSALERIESPVGHGELARRDDGGHRLSPRKGYVEVMKAASGEILYRGLLGENLTDINISVPIEAILAINSTGVWVRPTVIEAPEGESVDFEQINSMLKALQLEAFLEPGIYRILLGP